jgi:hypothetical protein
MMNQPGGTGLRWCGGLALLLCLALQEPSFALTPQEWGLVIFEEADRRNSGYVDLQVDLEMVLHDRRGDTSTRVLRIKQLEIADDGDKLLVVFDTPKAIKGTALLSYSHKLSSDDQWLYLPAIKRVKKIASRNKSGPFLGSEFSFEDLSAQEVERYTYSYVGDEVLNGQPCFVVERYPVDSHSGYAKQIVWLDESEYRIHKIEYYDRRESLLKTLEVDGYELHSDVFWKAGRMTMQNHRTHKGTQLHWRNYRFDTGLTNERDFTTNSLRRAR